MAPVLVAILFLFVIPFLMSRGFSGIFRVSVVMVIGIKLILILMFHAQTVKTYGIPIQLDASVDAKKYYDFGEAFSQYHLWEISPSDLIRERGGKSHLGYPYLNTLAFQFCPDHPILFLRIMKLLFFHVALGMLAVTWRDKLGERLAYVGYMILGVVMYQFLYYHFRNLKDDVILSLFMAVMALADRTLGAGGIEKNSGTHQQAVLRWLAIGLFLWFIWTIRLYLTAIILCAFGANLVTGRNIKLIYRALLMGVIGVGFLVMTGAEGWRMVEMRGGAGAVTGAAGNLYGLFKVFVSPLPWQHGNWFLAIPHTFYLLGLPIVAWAFFSNLRNNLDWKVYVVIVVALVVGALMEDFEPRKRYVMYPIFLSWVLTALAKRREAASTEVFDPNAYFAQARNIYA